MGVGVKISEREVIHWPERTYNMKSILQGSIRVGVGYE
jgi:hypothetical protein